ncbi:hypothetical protein V8F20_010164 [Naviculisporaceae sp. PSN 640]
MQRLLTLAAMLPSAMAVYYGCYKEISGGHAVDNDFLADFATGTPPTPGMTVAMCETHCQGLGWDLWALQNTGECRCGDSATALPAGAFPMFASDCQMPCAGDITAKCGGWGYFDLYGNSTTPPALTPAINPPLTTLTPLGCYTEGYQVRALAGAFHWSSTLTIAGCASFCQSSGYTIAGAEYGSECYCDNTLGNGSVPAPGDCTMDCSGDNTEKCGAGNRLSVFQWS